MTEQKLVRFVVPYTLESAAGAFERALAECKNPAIKKKVANYDEWLSNLWDWVKKRRAEGHMISSFYPTSVGTPVEDSYSEDMKPWIEKINKPFKAGEPSPCPLTHFPLEEKLDEILDNAGMIAGQKSNKNYFRIKDGVQNAQAFAKVYGCLITKKAVSFAEELAEFVKTNKFDFEGKFYELGDGGHNGLVLYVPFNNLSKIADWLATKKEYFHNVEFNHPAGVELFPGVSTIIAKENAAFDESIRHILDEVSRETGNDKRAFMQTAKEALENNVNVGYHFKWLKNNQEPKFAGFPPPPKTGFDVYYPPLKPGAN